MWYEIFEDGGFRLLLAIAALLTVLSAGAGYFVGSERCYFALAFTLLGGVCLFALFEGVAGKQLGWGVAFLGGIAAASYSPLYLALSLRRARKRKREENRLKKKRLQYTLPDRENTFLRDRLRTGLREEGSEEGEEEIRARLGYAKGMLARLKEQTLSPIERLDLEETATLVALLSKKGKWTAAEQKGINETLARLLKLAAKYEIAV